MSLDVRDFDPNFVPNAKQIDALKAILYGGYDGSDHSMDFGQRFSLDFQWLFESIPAANERLNELVEAGCVQEYACQLFAPLILIALTDEGIEWCETNLGFPKTDEEWPFDDPKVVEFVEGLTFARKATRIGSTTGKGVKATSPFVSQKSYTPAEAKSAIKRVLQARDKGEIKDGSAAAYRAHITRRIAQAEV